jgi:ferredoxin--NADP+ reductase
VPYKILEKKELNSVTHRIVFDAPAAAANAKAGQFAVLRIDEKGERIPLTINDSDPTKGTLAIIFQAVGKTTKALAALAKGDSVIDILGPLGKPTDFGRVGKVIFIAGGVGIAEALPVAKYAQTCGNTVSAIIGARTKELVILEDEMGAACDRVFVVTDDGSLGTKGLVTDPLKELLNKERFDLAYCVGPDIMMKAACGVTEPHGLKTLVSLDANMVDATGMCGTCRVLVGKEVKFTCVDGPEFDGHEVDWDHFLKRQKRFVEEEKLSSEFHEHKCRMPR